ncbi:hypothetical protein [Paenibacillus xylanexedens]|uniref:hypothetical protein n=1 Tax=Paenibacillus xylanexedens TaxID=528191 RepID=UPI00119DD884|nr:hypothetical protein [Paenibacillus xylanexedens]
MDNLNSESNSTEYVNKILEDIKKTGFLTELNVASYLVKNGWFIQQNKGYLDKDFNKSREIDIVSYKNFYNNDIRVGIHLIFEVKKSKRPWIIFTSNKMPLVDEPQYNILYYKSSDLAIEADLLNSYIRSSNARRGTAFHEAFKSPDEPSKIYEAILSSIKAMVSQYDKNLRAFNNTETTRNDVQIFIPIVLVEGKLFEAYLNEQGNLELLESDYVPLNFSYDSPMYEKNIYYPEIMTIKGLELFSNEITKWTRSIFEKLNSIKEI